MMRVNQFSTSTFTQNSQTMPLMPGGSFSGMGRLGSFNAMSFMNR